ncbi:uncharacterized protein LOC124209291 [Daphnia pulex]|uniref:uncharacterized protein LOC124209291 n=1 Tax=Daphnia pulex TaxID=6669 RepID=UPI001EE0BB61|nr:uncharacterized protein LOC124209291 [Daphnia pulex]
MSDASRNREAFSQQQVVKINNQFFPVAYWLCFLLGFASILIQIAVLVISGSLNSYVPHGLHDLGFAIWSGVFVLLAGCFGLASTFTRNNMRWIKFTLLMSTFSIEASIFAATLSGMAASNGVSTGCYDSTHGELCSTWINLEWSLMAVCVLAAIDSIVLIALTSDVFCCSNDKNATVNTDGHQVVIGTGDIGIGNSQQPVDVKQPTMQLNAQVAQQLM